MADIGVIKISRGFQNIAASDGTKLADLLAQVVVEEAHHQVMELTDHPVQRGAPISDHAFRRPAEVRVIYAWSDSPPAQLNEDAVTNAVIISPDTLTAREAYEAVLNLQSKVCLFDVVTGKKTYNNMICLDVAMTTDAKTENAAIMTLTLREVLLADVVTVSGIAASTAATPESNASPVQRGSQQLVPTNKTITP